jgi:hypothetical protein
MKKRKKSSRNKMTKDEYLEKYRKYLTSFKTVKTSLNDICRNEAVRDILTELVVRINNIKLHTYYFLKLFYLYQYENYRTFPDITTEFVRAVMSILTYNKANGRKPIKNKRKLLDQLEQFYQKHYKQYLPDKFNGSNISTLLDYLSIEIITSYKNHIQNNYVNIIQQFINQMCSYNETKKWIKQNKGEEEFKTYCATIYAIKCQAVYGTQYVRTNFDLSEYSYVVDYIHGTVFGNIDDPLALSQTEPLTLLPGLISLNKTLHQLDCKLFTCFPLKKSFVSGYITLDTTMLIRNFVSVSKEYFIKNQLTERDRIWNTFFRTNKNTFKKNNYEFNHQISTDGYSCSILFIRKDIFNPLGKNWIPTMKRPKNYKTERYVHELTDEEKNKILQTEIIGGDPGKHDLVHIVNGSYRITAEGNKKYNTIRYTQKTRSHDQKTKLYTQKIESLETKYFDPETKQHNNDLSKTNSRVCTVSDCREYIEKKLKVKKYTESLYEEELYRKLRWYRFINTQKSESQFINNLKTYYETDNLTLLIGDWCNSGMRGLPSTKGKGLRTMFRKYGIPVILVNEYNTSRKLAKDGSELKNFLKIKLKTQYRECHGLLRSKSAISGKSGHWYQIVNRDINGALNILVKGLCILMNKDIPSYLIPSKSNSKVHAARKTV